MNLIKKEKTKIIIRLSWTSQRKGGRNTQNNHRKETKGKLHRTMYIASQQ